MSGHAEYSCKLHQFFIFPKSVIALRYSSISDTHLINCHTQSIQTFIFSRRLNVCPLDFRTIIYRLVLIYIKYKMFMCLNNLIIYVTDASVLSAATLISKGNCFTRVIISLGFASDVYTLYVLFNVTCILAG